MSTVLSPLEVRTFISDLPECNHLLDGEEFSDPRIQQAIALTVDLFNIMTPISSYGVENFPSKTLLLYGTLGKLFSGAAALLARNTMTYSDGGLQIPVEERSQLYMSLAEMYNNEFLSSAKAFKIQRNIDDGWGSVSSDEIRFPIW